MFNFFKKNSSVPNNLFYSTDMHCHLIPGVDDGARNASESMELVSKEHDWGIKRIFCTPHITEETFENTPAVLADAFGVLKDNVTEHGIQIELDYSAEHRLDPFFLAQFEKGNIHPFPNNYLLIENSFIQEAWNIDQQVYDLTIKGFKPILAHPERYHYYINNRSRYEQLHASGLLFQINLLSLAGYYGKDQKQTAEWLIEKDMVDFIGSDMHHMRHAEAIDRYLASKDYQKHSAALQNRILNDIAF